MARFPCSQIDFVILNTLAQLLSPAGKSARLSIVIYHRVLVEPDLLLGDKGDAETFDLHLNYLTSHFNILPLHEAVQRLQNGTLPSRAVCITFDDGYADNAEIALPILQKYGVSATFFIAAGFVNGGMMWNDKVIELIRRASGDFLDLREMGLERYKINSLLLRQEALFSILDTLKYQPFETRRLQVEKLCELIPVTIPENFMMTPNQLRMLHSAGMEIGGHTVNHPILARLADNDAYTEIADGKEILENIIRGPIRLFAYPNGKPCKDYLPAHTAMLRRIGFEAAVSTAWGTAKNGNDLYQLPRFTPWDTGRLRFVLRMMQNMRKTVEVV
tara:strand:- start:918 stop:1910 length:993 start_codon:yes stop_codon:yes gene_type:complete